MPARLRYLVPSLADIFFLCVFLPLSLSKGNDLLHDLGTGVHIRTGEYILSNFRVPKSDVFSFISPPIPWVAHEWLSEVTMAVIHRISGLTGIVIFFSFLIAFTYLFLFRLLQARGSNIIVSCLIVFLVAASSALHWLARPHIFSLILMLIWYSVLESFQYKNKNYLYLLPPIMLFWVNLHGGFILGFILLAIYLCGNAARLVFSSEPAKEPYKYKCRALAYTALGCVLGSLVNPYGFHALLFPFQTVSHQFLIDTVMEYRSPNFHDPLLFKYLLLLTIAILTVSRAKVNAIELSLVLLFTYMALYSVRHIPLFGIVIAPLLARHTTAMLQKADNNILRRLIARSKNLLALDDQLRGHVWPALAVIVVCILAKTNFIHFNFTKTLAPAAAVNFLKREDIKGNMYNSDQFGDYVIYAAWPQYKVFVDGRSDMYGSDRMREYMKVALAQPGWSHILEKYDINFIFVGANSSLSLLLSENDNWRLVYADKIANVFVRNVAKNRDLMDKYPDVMLHLAGNHLHP